MGFELTGGNATRSAAEAARLDMRSRTAGDGRLVEVIVGDEFVIEFVVVCDSKGKLVPNRRALCTRSVDSFVALCSEDSRSKLSRFSNKLICGGGSSTRTAANLRSRLFRVSTRLLGVSSEMLLLRLLGKYCWLSFGSEKNFMNKIFFLD